MSRNLLLSAGMSLAVALNASGCSAMGGEQDPARAGAIIDTDKDDLRLTEVCQNLASLYLSLGDPSTPEVFVIDDITHVEGVDPTATNEAATAIEAAFEGEDPSPQDERVRNAATSANLVMTYVVVLSGSAADRDTIDDANELIDETQAEVGGAFFEICTSEMGDGTREGTGFIIPIPLAPADKSGGSGTA